VSGRTVAHRRDGAPITGCPAHKDRIAPHVQRSQKIREDQGRSGKTWSNTGRSKRGWSVFSGNMAPCAPIVPTMKRRMNYGPWAA